MQGRSGRAQAGAGKRAPAKTSTVADHARADGRTPVGQFAPGVSGNPLGKRLPNTTSAVRLDAWINRATGQGVAGYDKVMGLEFLADVVTDTEAVELWRGDDICKRVVEMPPSEMYREGFEARCDEPEVMVQISDELKRIGAVPVLKRAKMYERAYGGAAILPILNDANEDLREPLNKKRIREVQHLQVFEPQELDVISYYDDITEEKYRLPKIYRLNPISPMGTLGTGAIEIHESRLIIWRGVSVTHRIVSGSRPGWGDNVFTLMRSALRGFNTAHGSIGQLLADFSQAVVKMKDLARLVTLGQLDDITAKMRLIEYSRSVFNSVLIDAEEEYKRETTSVSGLAELVDRVTARLAAAANMQLTLMMGQSPKGLGNEGDSDLEWWYNQIGGLQLDDTPMVEQLIELIVLALDGPTKGKVPEGLVVEWRALYQPKDKDVADARGVQAITDEKYFGMGVLSTEDIAQSRFGGEKYSFETTIDWDARAQAEVDLTKALEERAAQKAAGGQPLEGEPGAAPAPNAPADMPAANGMAVDGSVQQTAFNGAQVQAMVQVVQAAIDGSIPRESAAAILSIAFPVTKAQAIEMLGPESFEATPAAPAAPFGGGGFGGPPKADPPADEATPDKAPPAEDNAVPEKAPPKKAPKKKPAEEPAE